MQIKNLVVTIHGHAMKNKRAKRELFEWPESSNRVDRPGLIYSGRNSAIVCIYRNTRVLGFLFLNIFKTGIVLNLHQNVLGRNICSFMVFVIKAKSQHFEYRWDNLPVCATPQVACSQFTEKNNRWSKDFTRSFGNIVLWNVSCNVRTLLP